MGYRNYNHGSFLPVACDGNKIQIWFNTGLEEFETKLNTKIERQVNEFYLPNVLFMMYKDNVRYVGREDGTISGYDVNDHSLVRISSWVLPPRPRLEHIGGAFYNRPIVADIDRVRNRTVYVAQSQEEYVFDKPFLKTPFLPEGLTGSYITDPRHLTIVTEDGSEVNTYESGHWCVQAPFDRTYPRGIF